MLLLPRIPRAALWLYGGSLATGFLNYLYNIVLARDSFLGPGEFGMLSAMSSLLYLEGVVVAVVATVTATYVARFLGRGEPGAIVPFVRRFSWRVGLVGWLLALGIGLSSFPLTQWLHIPSLWPFWWLALTFPIALWTGVTVGALQGALLFRALAWVTTVGALFRFILAIPLVGVLRWSVSGALVAGLLATMVAYGLSWWLLLGRYRRFNNVAGAQQLGYVALGDIFNYGHQVFWAMLGLTSLFAIDIVLAQRFLPAEQAGLYGGLSTLGRISYFVTLPFTTVMFPAVASRVAAGKSTRRVLGLTGGSILLLGVLIVGVYRFIPEFVINTTLGESYGSGSAILWLFGVFFGLVSVATWLLHVLLAQQRAGVIMLPPLALLLQLVLIARFHDSIEAIVTSSVVAVAVLVSSLGLRALVSPGPVGLAPAQR